MRVAWVTTGFLKDENDYGGIASMHNLARDLSSFPDLQLSIFALYYPIGLKDYTFHNARVFTFRNKGEVSLEVPKAQKLRAWRDCVRKFNGEHARSKFDLVHSIWSGESGYLSAYLSRKHVIPLITSICGGEVAQIPGINYGSRLKFFQKRFVRKTFRSADIITAGSEYVMEKVSRYFGKEVSSKVRKLPFGVDEEMFSPYPDKSKDKSAVKLINIATAFPVKGHNDLFKAFKIVVEKYPYAVLECYGLDTGKKLKGLVDNMSLNNNVRLLGNIDYKTIPLVLNSADIFVLSSLYESQNMAMLEAALCGLPVVSTDVGAASEVTDHCVSPGNYEALAERMLYVIANLDGEKRKSLGKIEDLKQKFSSHNSAKKFHELYISLHLS